MVFIISEDCSSFDGKWRYGTSGDGLAAGIGARICTGSGTSYLEANLIYFGFDFSQGTLANSPPTIGIHNAPITIQSMHSIKYHVDLSKL
jgi:hypothetical protein